MPILADYFIVVSVPPKGSYLFVLIISKRKILNWMVLSLRFCSAILSKIIRNTDFPRTHLL